MDLDNRVNRMDEELKLIKNEIRQVLLDIQEHVLNFQSPFAGITAGSFADLTSSSRGPAQVAQLEAQAQAAPAQPVHSAPPLQSQMPGPQVFPQGMVSGPVSFPSAPAGFVPQSPQPDYQAYVPREHSEGLPRPSSSIRQESSRPREAGRPADDPQAELAPTESLSYAQDVPADLELEETRTTRRGSNAERLEHRLVSSNVKKKIPHPSPEEGGRQYSEGIFPR